MSSVLGGDAGAPSWGPPPRPVPPCTAPPHPASRPAPRPAPRHQPHPAGGLSCPHPGTARQFRSLRARRWHPPEEGRASTQPLVPGCPTPIPRLPPAARLLVGPRSYLRDGSAPLGSDRAAGLPVPGKLRRLCRQGEPKSPAPALTERRPCGPGAECLAGARAPRGGGAGAPARLLWDSAPRPRLRRRAQLTPRARRAARRQETPLGGVRDTTQGGLEVARGARRVGLRPPVAAALPRPP